MVILTFVTAFGDDGLAVGVEERGEASAVAAVDEEIVHPGFLVNDDYRVCHQADAFFFLDIESVVCQ